MKVASDHSERRANYHSIGNRVFGPFPKVAHPLHEKSAKDGALCKRDKKRTGNLSVSGFFWSRWQDWILRASTALRSAPFWGHTVASFITASSNPISLRCFFEKKKKLLISQEFLQWSRWQDLNLRPFGPEIRTDVLLCHIMTAVVIRRNPSLLPSSDMDESIPLQFGCNRC